MLNANRTALLREYLHGAELLTAALAALPPESLDHRPGPDRWTSREIVCHLADAEVQAYVRCRVILSEPGATLPNYDQDAWATALDYGETALGPAVDLVDRLRRINHTLLQDLPDEAWSRAANHEVRGPVSLDDWLRTYVAHLHTHLAQIESNTASWQAGR